MRPRFAGVSHAWSTPPVRIYTSGPLSALAVNELLVLPPVAQKALPLTNAEAPVMVRSPPDVNVAAVAPPGEMVTALDDAAPRSVAALEEDTTKVLEADAPVCAMASALAITLNRRRCRDAEEVAIELSSSCDEMSLLWTDAPATTDSGTCRLLTGVRASNARRKCDTSARASAISTPSVRTLTHAHAASSSAAIVTHGIPRPPDSHFCPITPLVVVSE
mmetsp:Transcript_18689/g.46553  ORF Transcript_18689/g.46553 Transcript_18689/m.46553 type:complete len:219 (-) Transcript_18689:136-792(-)|eukprot:CAMPEP_0197578934 /NCGR_PEP_ID=MMETSP1326-20131121/3029_1 /TAXON_ID=1155430 /ORGANISM="Genus nov. species nov., Strain RCC2288" /LENGTH=218 /DNA_ID=CAMNT_0043142235 /DNA_START=413 /DNA_END=1069 /DNA_ORIENTATION=+